MVLHADAGCNRRLKRIVVILDGMPLHARWKPLELLLAAGSVMREEKRFMDIKSALLEMLVQTF
jgi:hypothetical protein